MLVIFTLKRTVDFQLESLSVPHSSVIKPLFIQADAWL